MQAKPAVRNEECVHSPHRARQLRRDRGAPPVVLGSASQEWASPQFVLSRPIDSHLAMRMPHVPSISGSRRKMSRTSDKIRRARGTVDDVMLELFGPQIVDGQCHSRVVGIASDYAERNQHAARKIAIDQRLDAGLHMCLTVASAALEVSRELLSNAAYAHVGNGESALNRCAQDADLVVQAARRAHAILASRYGGLL